MACDLEGKTWLQPLFRVAVQFGQGQRKRQALCCGGVGRIRALRWMQGVLEVQGLRAPLCGLSEPQPCRVNCAEAQKGSRAGLEGALAEAGLVQRERALALLGCQGGHDGTWTALHAACGMRSGGGDGGCAGCVYRMLCEVGDHPDCSAWVNVRSTAGYTALFCLAINEIEHDADVQLPMVVALLAYGADATITDNVSARSVAAPTAIHASSRRRARGVSSRGNRKAVSALVSPLRHQQQNPTVAWLLRLAEVRGGVFAARHLLTSPAASPQRTALGACLALSLLALLPQVLELWQQPLRVLLAVWAEHRKYYRDNEAKCEGGEWLALWSGVPRSCVAEVMLQCSLLPER